MFNIKLNMNVLVFPEFMFGIDKKYNVVEDEL
jgi:hypothetical protein